MGASSIPEFAKHLHFLRKQANLSQEDVAEHLHISRQAISKWEQGQSTPDIDTCIKLCELLKVTPNQLLLGLDNTDEHEPRNKRSHRVIHFIISSVFLMLVFVCGTILLIWNLYNGLIFEPNIHTMATLMVWGSPIAFVIVLIIYIRKNKVHK